MKEEINLEEILNDVFGENLNQPIYNIKDSKTMVLKAMKEACDKTLELAADNAISEQCWYCNAEDIKIDKESILKLKDKIK